MEINFNSQFYKENDITKSSFHKCIDCLKSLMIKEHSHVLYKNVKHINTK